MQFFDSNSHEQFHFLFWTVMKLIAAGIHFGVNTLH